MVANSQNSKKKFFFSFHQSNTSGILCFNLLVRFQDVSSDFSVEYISQISFRASRFRNVFGGFFNRIDSVISKYEFRDVFNRIILIWSENDGENYGDKAILIHSSPRVEAIIIIPLKSLNLRRLIKIEGPSADKHQLIPIITHWTFCRVGKWTFYTLRKVTSE